jgi:hypothetical protein
MNAGMVFMGSLRDEVDSMVKKRPKYNLSSR